MESVISTIKELHTRHYKGSSVKGTDIVNVKQKLKRDTFEATGMGVPPKKLDRGYNSSERSRDSGLGVFHDQGDRSRGRIRRLALRRAS